MSARRGTSTTAASNRRSRRPTTRTCPFRPKESADTFTAPGRPVSRALPFETDTAARLASSSFHDVCTAAPLQTYDDGVFVGHIQSFDACGGTATRNVVAVADPADGAFTAILDVQLTGICPTTAPTLNGLLLSFNRAKIADPGPTAGVVDTPTTTAAVGDACSAGCNRWSTSSDLTLTDEQGGLPRRSAPPSSIPATSPPPSTTPSACPRPSS